MPSNQLERFWNDYAAYYSRLNLSPVFKGFVTDTIRSASIREHDQILDIGCGPGHFVEALCNSGGHVTAVDYSEKMLARARETFIQKKQLYERKDYQLIRADALRFLQTTPDDSFDIVLASLFLSYTMERSSVLDQIRRVLKPGGRFVMSNPVPNPPFWRVFLKSGWTAVRNLGYSFMLLAYASKIKQFERDGLFRFFTESETRSMLVKAGFDPESISSTFTFAETVYLTSARKLARSA